MEEIPEGFEWLLALGSKDCSEHNPPRARRFDIQLPIRYRARGETAWYEGRTANISHSGVRFWTDRLIEVHTPIEMNLQIPAYLGGEAGAEIVCRGEIVRTVLPASTDDKPSLAARILEYRFVRSGESSAA